MVGLWRIAKTAIVACLHTQDKKPGATNPALTDICKSSHPAEMIDRNGCKCYPSDY